MYFCLALRGCWSNLDDDWSLRSRAENGDKEAMFEIGVSRRLRGFLSGLDGAEYWFRKACNDGHPGACKQLESLKKLRTEGQASRIIRSGGQKSRIVRNRIVRSRGPQNLTVGEQALNEELEEIPRITGLRLSYQEKLSLLGERKKIKRDLTFNAFQIKSTLTMRQAYSYACGHGLNHSQELRSAMKSLGFQNQLSLHRLGLVDILDVGCGPGMTLDVLLEFGLHINSYSGFDYADSFVWLARELNNDVEGNFVVRMPDLPTSKRTGFILMNHVLNQDEVTTDLLKTWIQEFKRIYSKGFSLLSIEPTKADYDQKFKDFEKICLDKEIKIKNKRSTFSESKSYKKIPKRVNYWACCVGPE